VPVRLLVVLAVAVLAALVLAACDSGLTVERIERELRSDIPEKTAERGVRVTDVDCPDDADVSEGSTFQCEVPAVENGQDVIYTATVTVDGSSSLRWELTGVRLADQPDGSTQPPATSP
jgi:hypothetical protein